MSKQLVVDSLRTVHFLHDIADEFLEQIAEMSELVSIESGQTLFREGQPPEYVYLVVSGSVSMEICAAGVGCKSILTVGAGEILGWSTLLEQSQLTATARAVEATRVVRIPGGLLVNLCRRNPKFGYEVMRRTALALAKRLTATRLQLLDVYGSEMPGTDKFAGE